jgi:predicted PurR-regulated permease PerM
MRRSTAKLRHLLFLGLSGPVIALNLWLLSQVYRYFEGLITVLAVAGILAFLLNYPVKMLEKLHLRRTQAVILVSLVAIALLVILGITLVPILIDQTAQLVGKVPGWLAEFRDNLESWDTWAQRRRIPLNLQGWISQISTSIDPAQVQIVFSQALGFLLGTVSGLISMVLVIVLSFYMLLYGDRMWRGLVNLLPDWLGPILSVSLRLNFQNFLISQLLLGLFMFGVLTPIFLLLNVPFALLFALVIGVANLIPLIGAALGIGTVVLLVLFQDGWMAVRVAIAATAVQQIKDNVLAPPLMGDFVGLNPIWILITLMLGGQIAGLLGVFLAVPIAGTIKLTIDQLRQPASALQLPQVNTEGRRQKGEC